MFWGLSVFHFTIFIATNRLFEFIYLALSVSSLDLIIYPAELLFNLFRWLFLLLCFYISEQNTKAYLHNQKLLFSYCRRSNAINLTLHLLIDTFYYTFCFRFMFSQRFVLSILWCELFPYLPVFKIEVKV